MLRNRSLQVQMVKTPKTEAPEEASKKLTPEQFSHVVKEQTTNAALLIGAVFATKVVLSTASEITLIFARSKFK